MRQEVTRAHKGWALDNVTLHNEVMKQMAGDVKSSPSVRKHFTNFTFVYIHFINSHFLFT